MYVYSLQFKNLPFLHALKKAVNLRHALKKAVNVLLEKAI